MYLFNFLNKHLPEYLSFFSTLADIEQAEKSLKKEGKLHIYDCTLFFRNGKISAKTEEA